MLKFSGYSYLIRGQPEVLRALGDDREEPIAGNTTTLGTWRLPHLDLGPAIARRAQYQAVLDWTRDARTGMPPGMPRGAMCVQRFDDSLNSAIHITCRISLRSSSMPEPRDPLLKVLTIKS